MFKRLMQKLQLSSTKGIQSAIWIVLILLGVVLVSFAGYYYWDRYVRLEDQSPLERDIATMEEVILENPDDPEARVALAEFYLNKGMVTKVESRAEEKPAEENQPEEIKEEEAPGTGIPDDTLLA